MGREFFVLERISYTNTNHDCCITNARAALHNSSLHQNQKRPLGSQLSSFSSKQLCGGQSQTI